MLLRLYKNNNIELDLLPENDQQWIYYKDGYKTEKNKLEKLRPKMM